MHAGRGLYRTFSGLSAPASESTTERPDVSLPSALFTVTTDLSIACIISCVCAQKITVYYLQRCYLQRNRPLQFSDCAINSSVYISVWKCKLPFLLLAVFRVFAALVLESSSELVNAFVDFSQNTVVSETHARHRKKLVVWVIVQRGGDDQLSRVKKKNCMYRRMTGME